MFKYSLHYVSKSNAFGTPDYCTMFSNGIYQGFFTEYRYYMVNSIMKIFMVKMNLSSKPVVFHYSAGELMLQPGQSKVSSYIWRIPYDCKPGYYCIEGYDDSDELRNNKFYIPVTILGV